MTDVTLYRVGGCVRDEIMGRKYKDIDYAVEASSFEAMEAWVAERGRIYQSRPEFLTVRAKVDGEDADFVLCRKDGAYSDGRRPDSVEAGSILDDLARRDFTMNAIAKRPNGSYCDPHKRQHDIERRLIRTVGNPRDRFKEDALRLLRAFRFAITLDFSIDDEIDTCMRDDGLLDQLRSVSVERQSAELAKCFEHDTAHTLNLLDDYQSMRTWIFDGSKIWLKPTLEAR